MSFGTRLKSWFTKSSSSGTGSNTRDGNPQLASGPASASTSAPAATAAAGAATPAPSSGHRRRAHNNSHNQGFPQDTPRNVVSSTPHRAGNRSTRTGDHATSSATTTVNGGSAAAGQPAPRRRRRRRRRASSPVGLPLYSASPGDDEMSLFKGADVSRVDLNDDGASDNDQRGLDTDDDSERVEDLDPGGAPLTAGSRSMASSVFTVPLVGGRARSGSDAPSITLSLFEPGFGSPLEYVSPPGSASVSTSDLMRGPAPPPLPGAVASTSARPIVHRSTQSSPSATPLLNSPHSPFSTSPVSTRARSSTLRSLFRGRNVSSSNLSDSPPGNSSIAVGRSPYGQGPGFSSSPPSTRAASGSTTSIRSTLSISAPLQHTLVSSSFVFPKSGPTASQIAFISSREALGAYGYGRGAESAPSIDDDPESIGGALSPPPPFEDSPPLSASSSLSPTPSPNAMTMTTTMNNGSLSAPTYPLAGMTRGSRSASVSSHMSSSPLSRVHTQSGDEDEEDEDQDEVGDDRDEGAEFSRSGTGASTMTVRPGPGVGVAAAARMSDDPTLVIRGTGAVVPYNDLEEEEDETILHRGEASIAPWDRTVSENTPMTTPRIAQLEPEFEFASDETIETRSASFSTSPPNGPSLRIECAPTIPKPSPAHGLAPLVLLSTTTPISPLFPTTPGGTAVLLPSEPTTSV
ncbi:BZ3500_MvSof-1268-A1-R1_Chr9g10842 [Microbotryum saponariae]|uniref:BZ3500_MvSof-1268-A1-R1_Chr9g10842 protein n=1 Tax=Microbotryum saponariae TaxID=289078 RepID=A0A2X0L476_9BASI|nr:BZ3501_MvSof-1269-A2-R1_Chr9g10590 [Microbotryum saponariae]SDA00790.1 BZ3500_MvSof-1268-A1-R1_Chr9g10842 [Microbotryum saponariae]